VHVPAEIDVQRIRRSLHLSQNEFASRFGISPGTLRDWAQEAGRPGACAAHGDRQESQGGDPRARVSA
jgi:DNA-binding transcriptional regulator YiaG